MNYDWSHTNTEPFQSRGIFEFPPSPPETPHGSAYEKAGTTDWPSMTGPTNVAYQQYSSPQYKENGSYWGQSWITRRRNNFMTAGPSDSTRQQRFYDSYQNLQQPNYLTFSQAQLPQGNCGHSSVQNFAVNPGQSNQRRLQNQMAQRRTYCQQLPSSHMKPMSQTPFMSKPVFKDPSQNRTVRNQRGSNQTRSHVSTNEWTNCQNQSCVPSYQQMIEVSGAGSNMNLQESFTGYNQMPQLFHCMTPHSCDQTDPYSIIPTSPRRPQMNTSWQRPESQVNQIMKKRSIQTPQWPQTQHFPRPMSAYSNLANYDGPLAKKSRYNEAENSNTTIDEAQSICFNRVENGIKEKMFKQRPRSCSSLTTDSSVFSQKKVPSCNKIISREKVSKAVVTSPTDSLRLEGSLNAFNNDENTYESDARKASESNVEEIFLNPDEIAEILRGALKPNAEVESVEISYELKCEFESLFC